ncbi:MAG: Response regulator of zinc sigma-54-dependent two-component system [Fibrobacteres bacterium]|nr:Response regulator of zinc sigma-54-dependent two-component system [Fibrobacterota bacterium]
MAHLQAACPGCYGMRGGCFAVVARRLQKRHIIPRDKAGRNGNFIGICEVIPMKHKLLIIDDDRTNVDALSRALHGQDVEVAAAIERVKAIELARERLPQVIIAGVRMPGENGMEVLAEIRDLNPNVQTILMAGPAGVDEAIAAMKRGACDFIPKPFEKRDVLAAVHRAFEKSALLQENLFLKDKLKKNQAPAFEWGKSRAFRTLLDRAAQAALSDATILIMGEAGNGKEVLAQHIYSNSLRAHRPFVSANCASIPENLLEAELFGYRKGAFNGAWQDKKGKVQEANGGTLFLDEVGELPLGLQPKLLRVLQEGEANPLSGGLSRVDVRIIAATSRNLRKLVADGLFREDLFYRLNVIPLHIPPLRSRPEDLHSLISFFISKYCKKTKKANLSVNAGALRMMEAYAWPGNVRELENAVERAVILCMGHQITPEDLPDELTHASDASARLFIGQGMTLEEIELAVIQNAMKRNNGDKAKTAEDLGISLRTVYRKLDTASNRVSARAAPVFSVDGTRKD